MTASWMDLFLAALVGASVSWLVCSLWAVRMLDAERRRARETRQELNDFMKGIVPVDTPLMQELTRLQQQERWNRERA